MTGWGIKMGVETNNFTFKDGLLVPTHFGYNAVVNKGRRQSPKTSRHAEVKTLTKGKRNKMLATAQDQNRNHALVAWAIRKHLDYVSSFSMSFRTDFIELNNIVNRIFKWHGSPENFDYIGKFGRNEAFRFFELEKVIAGDAAMIKLKNTKTRKNKLFMLESDLIVNGSGAPEGFDTEGLIKNKGKVTKYCVCNRGDRGSSKIYDHTELAGNIIFDAYWNRYGSQYRGVSPLSVAINSVQDVAEAMEFNLLKAKMQALFGMVITRKSVDGVMGGAVGPTSETQDAEAEATGTTYDLNPRAINILDLNENEDAKPFESATPSSEFVEGCYLYIQVALLALDIPITSFDSRRSTFSARIADLNEYEVSVYEKQRKNRYARQNYSDWLLRNIWNEGDFNLRATAEKHNLSLQDVQQFVDWVPNGSPWLDKFKQLKGDQLAVQLLQDNPIDAAKRRGQDVFENIDKIKKVSDYAKEHGVPWSYATANDRTIQEIIEDEIQSQKESDADETQPA